MPTRLVSPIAFLMICGVFTVAAHCQDARLQNDFAASFSGATIRLDFYHLGTASQEHFALASVRQEGPWPGSRTQMLDNLNLGDYMLVIQDAQTNTPIFSRGFNSDFEGTTEWSVSYTSLRFPFPKNAVQISIKKRNKDNVGFFEISNHVIDPNGPDVDRAPLPSVAAETLLESGSPATRVDIAIVGDGYSAEQRSQFIDDARCCVDYLFSVAPYRERKSSFNVRAVFCPSTESGVSSPLDGIWRDTPFRVSYNAGNVERRMGINRPRMLREVAATVPYDYLILLANATRYGGSGTYQGYCIAPIHNSLAKYLVLHEFGHTFAGLADEYYVEAEPSAPDNPPSTRKPEPWRPNVTTATSRDVLKWRALINPKTPVPTPWERREYEDLYRDLVRRYLKLRADKAPEEKIDQLAAHGVPTVRAVLRMQKYSGAVGLFEGAAGEAHGCFRSELDCTMFTESPDGFCAACRTAIERVIASHTR